MWLIPGPWTHHPRSSPSHLQLLEEVLQLLPLDVSITLEQRDHNYMLMQHHKWHCFSGFFYFLPVVLMCKKFPNRDTVTVSNRSLGLPWYWFKHEPFNSNSLPPLLKDFIIDCHSDHSSKDFVFTRLDARRGYIWEITFLWYSRWWFMGHFGYSVVINTAFSGNLADIKQTKING